jgi:NarL family two-component system response regulator YdfI
MDDKLKVMVVDDHLVVREGLRLILETEEEFEVIAEATDGAAALRHLGHVKPDVVLMDLRMPGMDGLEALERIQADTPDLPVVVLTTYDDDDLIVRALGAGARGYLLKDSGREALLATVRAAARNETLLKPDLLARLVKRAVQPSKPERTALRTSAGLSGRELEVLDAVSQGLRNKEIADRLGLSERTVKAHLAAVFNKLGVDSRAAAVAVAVEEGLVSRVRKGKPAERER